MSRREAHPDLSGCDTENLINVLDIVKQERCRRTCLFQLLSGQLQLAQESGERAAVQVPVVPHVLDMRGPLKLQLRNPPAQALLPLLAPLDIFSSDIKPCICKGSAP